MDSWMLSDEDPKIREAVLDGWEDDALNIARAQLRKVWDEGTNPCPHNYQTADTSKASKHECPECWYELKKEAGLEDN